MNTRDNTLWQRVWVKLCRQALWIHPKFLSWLILELGQISARSVVVWEGLLSFDQQWLNEFLTCQKIGAAAVFTFIMSTSDMTEPSSFLSALQPVHLPPFDSFNYIGYFIVVDSVAFVCVWSVVSFSRCVCQNVTYCVCSAQNAKFKNKHRLL